jgi:hypothetical protein
MAKKESVENPSTISLGKRANNTLQIRKRFKLKLVHVKSWIESKKYLLADPAFCPIYFDIQY